MDSNDLPSYRKNPMAVKHGTICNLVTKGDVVITIYLRNSDPTEINGISNPREPESFHERPADDEAPHVPIAEPDFGRPAASSEEDRPWLVCGRCNASKL
jgi:hypothetical protein